MPRATVCKQFSFHAAHQLPNHDGACRNLHGHTYTMEILVHGPVSTEFGHPKEGMVIDFTDLKKIYQTHVEPLVEHMNLNETLPVSVTTAENIAAWAFKTFRDNGVGNLHAVRVWETPTSYAEFKNGDALRA